MDRGNPAERPISRVACPRRAWELKISERTVKMHRALLLEGLGVGTSAEAIRMAVEAGL